MADLFLQHVDPDQFRKDIVADVIEAIAPLLADNREPRLVDRQRMADLLNVSLPHLDCQIRDGLIPSKLIGKRRLFDPAEVIAALPTEGGVEQ
ncbi:helix-turn-helix domain-containing protein [Rosistilla oblonga]|uniref:Helix-turn-helix domain protein n=1 Tax=Rosistilla oblonga TaxID=2527990 RepID=A0A518ITI4_9BACT|nr:helix-turn-helix domain-containing protein [Rosistilla oblonga]QDV56393.1 hypothetical protein Mal33_23830 [Rosistilla oblonga]